MVEVKAGTARGVLAQEKHGVSSKEDRGGTVRQRGDPYATRASSEGVLS